MCSRGGHEKCLWYLHEWDPLYIFTKQQINRQYQSIHLTFWDGNLIAGYWIGGFGLGESMDERPSLLNAVTVNLPSHKMEALSLPFLGKRPLISLFICSWLKSLALLEWVKHNLVASQLTNYRPTIWSKHVYGDCCLAGYDVTTKACLFCENRKLI